MAVIETGGSVAGTTNVDSNFNVQMNLPYTTPAWVNQGGWYSAAWFSSNANESDAGSITGVRDVKATELTSNFRTRSAVDQTMLNEVFPWTVLNSNIWTAPVTTSTISVSGWLLTLNNGASLVSGAVARVATYRSFPVLSTYPLYTTAQIQFSSTPVANCVHEWGNFIASWTTAPTDGAYFTINAAAELRCVVNTNGTINQSSVLNYSTLIGANSAHEFLIYIGTDVVTFWIDNVKVYEATLASVSALGIQTASGQIPLTFRSYNSNTVTGTAQLMKISAVNMTLAEMANGKQWSHIQAGAGLMSYQGQTGQATLGTQALYTNSLASGAGAVMTNTTAALGSGLGGQFTALPTLAAGTDGIMSSFQVPVGTVAIPWKSLYITWVSIQWAVSVVLVGNATPVIYAHSLAFGHNAVSLATTVSTTSKAPVRVPLGIESYGAAAALGTLGQSITRDFSNAPVVVYPGEFIQIASKNIGVVTTTGAITWLVSFTGYWE